MTRRRGPPPRNYATRSTQCRTMLWVRLPRRCSRSTTATRTTTLQRSTGTTRPNLDHTASIASRSRSAPRAGTVRRPDVQALLIGLLLPEDVLRHEVQDHLARYRRDPSGPYAAEQGRNAVIGRHAVSAVHLDRGVHRESRRLG